MIERWGQRLRRQWHDLRQPAQWRLLIHQAGQSTRSIDLPPGRYAIGRDASGPLQFDHPAVSRRHGLLERRGRLWVLGDDGSTNGLWWRGRRVQQLLLHDGDAVRLAPPQQAGVPELVWQRRPPSRSRALQRLLLLSLLSMAGGGLLLLALGLLTVPIRGSLATVRGPLVLYDARSRPVVTAEGRQHRELAGLNDYPRVLIQALLASEDSRFWWHPGVDPIGTTRALLTNLLGGRVLEGGSTLTQQLARSLYPEQVGEGETLERKWRELLVALQLEARFSKRDLLLSYLNRVYLGVGWGFEDAARRYFGRSARDLDLEQAALLVGLLPSPNGYDPCLNPQAALEARNRVLAKMVDSGRLTADEARAARRRPVRLASTACRASQGRTVPYYSDQVRRDLASLVGGDVAAEGNFLIDTHLDPVIQATVERLLRQRLEASAALAVGQGAVVVLDSRSGGIVAIAGGRDYRQSQFNRATMAQRQPGSTFKLMTYAAALERGHQPGDRLNCGPFQWQGQQFASGCGGSLSLSQALAVSSNTAALRLAERIGLDAVIQKARDLGIASPLQPVPGLVLGQSEVTLLELTAAYAAVANDGVWNPPTTIRRVTDAEVCPDTPQDQSPKEGRCGRGGGDRAAVIPGRRVMASATARSLQSMLQAVVRGGTGTAAWLGGREGGKTGTTNRGRDLLFVGMEPSRHLVVGIWLGNDDNSPTGAGSALAASLWGEILSTIPRAR
ncbi:MAG: transglycosylase domain-containing protein [Cyanobacteriota bacterium]|nr:transglycosylase domain-containing protein [Cyanobacteriota bacterium]